MADSATVQLTMNIDLVDSSQIRLAALIVEAVRTSKHDWPLSGDVDAVADARIVGQVENQRDQMPPSLQGKIDEWLDQHRAADPG